MTAICFCLATFSCAGAGHLSAGTQKFHINHLGYDLAAPKRAVVEAGGAAATFKVVNAESGEAAFEGQLAGGPGFVEWGGGPNFYLASFSALEVPGKYQLEVNGSRSEPFVVVDHLLFQVTAKAVVGYFRAMRADAEDTAVWQNDAAVSFIDKDGTRDVRGGWYDASGDISKYLSHLSYANYLNPQQTPLVAWALAWARDAAGPLLESQGLAGEVEAEALWGADFLVRMQDPEGYFYATVFDGWSGSPMDRKICAFSGIDGTRNANYKAAFREGGGLAIASLARVSRWGKASADFQPSAYLDAARRGFAHLERRNSEYADDQKENIIDDYSALLAASELAAATSDATYVEKARKRAASLTARQHPSGYFVADGTATDGKRPFWHASDAGLPVVALVRYAEVETDASEKSKALAAIQVHLDYLVDVTRSVPNPYGYARQHTSLTTSAFFIPHDNESGYWWQGENARLASLTAAALLGGRATHTAPGERLGIRADVASFALDQLDWILGKNPFDVGMMAGIGRNNPDPYPNGKKESGTRVGGIANGITSRELDGGGIQWDKASGREGWQRWRWTEQWLPHAAWYLVAVTALSEAELAATATTTAAAP